MTRVVLVRHGETEWNRRRRVQGWAPSSLNDRGRGQARAAASHLADRYAFDRIVASDLRRAKETARLLRRAFPGAPVSFDRGWRERDFGTCQGLSYEALFEGYPEFAFEASGYAAADARPEGGERMLDTRDRVFDAWDRLVATAADGASVLVVTHGGPIRLLLHRFAGLDLVAALTDLDLGNCSVSEFDAEGTAVTVVRRNDAGYLDRATGSGPDGRE